MTEKNRNRNIYGGRPPSPHRENWSVKMRGALPIRDVGHGVVLCPFSHVYQGPTTMLQRGKPSGPVALDSGPKCTSFFPQLGRIAAVGLNSSLIRVTQLVRSKQIVLSLYITQATGLLQPDKEYIYIQTRRHSAYPKQQ